MQNESTRENPHADNSTLDLAATAPGQLRVIKRNGTVVPYTDDKITVAITKAFLAVEGNNASASSRIHDTVARLTEQVTATFKRRMPSGGTIHIEEIQDQVELALMRSGEQKVARDYVIYRESRSQERKRGAVETPVDAHPSIRIKRADGSMAPLDLGRLNTIITEACEGLEEVDGSLIQKETLKNLYDGVEQTDVNTALVMTARTLVEREPNYSYVTARLLMDTLRAEALSFLEVAESATHHEMADLYAKALPAYVEKGVQFELLDPRLKEYDLAKLGAAINHEQDQQFTYLGLQTLYDRYFIHKDGVRFELPQIFFMRVAMGLAIEEENREARAIEFYNLLSSFDYMASTPTLFNAGTLRPQLSSCYLTTVPDDLGGIYDAIRDNALLSKFAGGLGNDWTPVRALGAYIKGTNGKSQGVVPFLKVVNDTAVAVNQGGKRKGAVCAYLETWHLDIEEFLELRKNTGDDRRRTHDMNTANWIPDLFMKRVFDDGPWTLFSPSDVPDLHDLTGRAFEERYEYYEELTKYGKIKLFKTLPAKDLWRKMLSMLFETGHPWLTFKDPCNLRSPQQHVGVVHSSNLCTEITLNTSKTRSPSATWARSTWSTTSSTASWTPPSWSAPCAPRCACSITSSTSTTTRAAGAERQLQAPPGGPGHHGLRRARTCSTSLRFRSRHRLRRQVMEAISYFAIQASCDLADERGAYPASGSLWSLGILPLTPSRFSSSAWPEVHRRGPDRIPGLGAGARARQERHPQLQHHGHRADRDHRQHHRRVAVHRADVQNLYVKSNLSGEFTVINPYLVHLRKAAACGMRSWSTTSSTTTVPCNRSSASRRIERRCTHRLRGGNQMDRRRRQPPPEVDRSGQSLNLYIAGASAGSST